MSFLSGLQRMAVSGLAADCRRWPAHCRPCFCARRAARAHARTWESGFGRLFLGTGGQVCHRPASDAGRASFMRVTVGAVAFLVLRFVVNQSPLIGSQLAIFRNHWIQLDPCSGHSDGRTEFCGRRRPASTARPHHWRRVAAVSADHHRARVCLGTERRRDGRCGPDRTGSRDCLHNRYGRACQHQMLGASRHALAHRISGFEQWARGLQGIAGAAIVLIAAYSIWTAL